MKFLILALLALPTNANWFSGVGEYSLPHKIAFMNYETAEACAEDGGTFEDELCWMDASDDISVVDDGAGELDVSVFTITTNAHMCEFEGKGKFTAEGTIVASAPTEIWDGDNSVPAVCDVTLTFVDGNTVNVSNNGNCAYFCGARASLDIEGAKRK